MNENDRKDPGEAEGDGRAAHGYRNEVSWDGGKGRQPYSNQGTEEQGTAAARGYAGAFGRKARAQAVWIRRVASSK